MEFGLVWYFFAFSNSLAFSERACFYSEVVNEGVFTKHFTAAFCFS
ncbi:hypothetical protein [Candidatus Sarmatiella mevalonica]|nr:hypothetical protein [Candidatus Sarmatiella mevalonica]